MLFMVHLVNNTALEEEESSRGGDERIGVQKFICLPYVTALYKIIKRNKDQKRLISQWSLFILKLKVIDAYIVGSSFICGYYYYLF